MTYSARRARSRICSSWSTLSGPSSVQCSPGIHRDCSSPVFSHGSPSCCTHLTLTSNAPTSETIERCMTNATFHVARLLRARIFAIALNPVLVANVSTECVIVLGTVLRGAGSSAAGLHDHSEQHAVLSQRRKTVTYPYRDCLILGWRLSEHEAQVSGARCAGRAKNDRCGNCDGPCTLYRASPKQPGAKASPNAEPGHREKCSLHHAPVLQMF